MAILGVRAYSGSIRYPYSKPTGTSAGDGGGGGTGGGGVIWSSTDQIIWITIGSVKYPVHLKPGKNDISFWIPSLFPEDTWIETQLVIEAPGYILIPAGFKFDIFTGEGAPSGTSILKLTDKIKITDFYSIDIVDVPVPPEPPADIDSIISEYEYSDFITTDILNISIKDTSYIDVFSVEDVNNLDSVNIQTSSNNSVDSAGFEDFVDIDIE